MASATAMDFPHDRRLSIRKPSSARIAKRTASSAAPSRTIASPNIVKASPSTFRRVVQELTGSTTPSPPPPPPSAPSRLQRMAPPPLPPHFKASLQHARAPDRQLLLLQANQQHQQQRHQQQQQQQQRHQQQQQQQQLMAMTMPHLSPINPLHAPLLRASTPLASSPLLPGQFPHPHPLIPPLPMLSPRLFSPLPSLTPGDNAWACPLDVLPPVPAPIPYPLPLPPPGRNGDGAFNGVSERLERGPPPPPISPLQMPISPAARFPWPSPWSPYFPVSPVPPIYPGYFSPSPGFGISNLYSGSTASNGPMDFSSPRDFTFQSPSDYGFFKPS